MDRSVLQPVLKLSTAERILLAERLWDSVADEDVALTLTEARRRSSTVGCAGSGRRGHREATGPPSEHVSRNGAATRDRTTLGRRA